MYGRGKKLSKPRKQNIRNPFLSKENKEKVKDRIIRDNWKLFEISNIFRNKIWNLQKQLKH